MSARPVITCKKSIAASNKVDHFAAGTLIVQQAERSEAARFHIIDQNRPVPRKGSGSTNEPPLNLFCKEALPPSRYSAQALRARDLDTARERNAPDCRRKTVLGVPATISLRHDAPSTTPPPSSRRSEYKTPVSIISHSENAPPAITCHSGRRMSPCRQTTPTYRVLQPEVQEHVRERRYLSGPKPQDHPNAFRRASSVGGDLPRPTIRTKIEPFSFDAPSSARQSMNPRHVVAVPQPSSLFGGDRGQKGLCLWDYTFSSNKKPTPSALLPQRAGTPDPKRSAPEVLHTGRRRVTPLHLLW